MPMPLAHIDVKALRSLASIGCTQAEAAVVLGVSLRCLEDRMRRPGDDGPSAERIAWDEGAASLRVSLRRLQYDAAKKGNTTMLIWLGKQLLGQRDDPGAVTPANQIDAAERFLKASSD